MENTLPKNWVEIKLSDISLIQSGGTPSRSNKDYWNGNIPWLKISDFKSLYINEAEEFITDLGLQNSSARIFKSGTILFTIFASIGKIGILNFDASTNQAIAGITPTDKVSHKYLVYSLKELSESVQNEGKGVAQKNINQQILKDTLIPLPPLAEQERIVAKLDALFAQHEKMKQALDKIPQLLKDFRQQVLTQAVTGKLTEQWRERKELEEIHLNFDQNPKGDLKKFRNEFGLNFKYDSKGWVKTNFFNLCILKRGFDLPANSRDLNGVYKVASSSGASGNHSEYKLEYGLIVGRSGSVGKTFWIDEKFWPLNTTLYSENFNNNYPKFVYYYLLNFDFMKYSSSTAVPTLNRNNFIDIEVNFPSLEEQQEIVSRVESLFAKADAIEARYQTLKAKIDSLPQALLHKAFKGELVPQLPTDGDAKELLAEIMQLKEEAKARKGKKK